MICNGLKLSAFGLLVAIILASGILAPAPAATWLMGLIAPLAFWGGLAVAAWGLLSGPEAKRQPHTVGRTRRQ